MVKRLSGLCIVALLLCTASLHAQEMNTLDSLSADRNKVSKQIIQLRDTISLKVVYISNKLSQTTPTHKPVAEKATRDLKFYQAQLEKGLDEIINTKVWQGDIKERSTRLLSDMRQKFKITEKELEKIGYP